MEWQYNRTSKKLYAMGAAAIFFLLLLPAFRLIPAGAQTQPPTENGWEPGLDAKIDAFFGALRLGNTSAAFTEILRDSLYSSPATNVSTSEIQIKVEALKGQIGEIIRWEKLDEKIVGSDIIVYRYILKYDLHPVIWTFYFYRKPIAPTALNTTPNAWGLDTMYFDPDLRNL